jgi:hypothetical protein
VTSLCVLHNYKLIYLHQLFFTRHISLVGMPILYIWRRRDHSWLRRYCAASKMIQASLSRGFVWSLLLTYQHSFVIVLAWRISPSFTILCKGFSDHRLYFCILFWCVNFHFTKFYNHSTTPFKLILSTMDVHYANLEVSYIHYLYFDVLTIHVMFHTIRGSSICE